MIKLVWARLVGSEFWALGFLSRFEVIGGSAFYSVFGGREGGGAVGDVDRFDTFGLTVILEWWHACPDKGLESLEPPNLSPSVECEAQIITTSACYGFLSAESPLH